MIAVIFIIAAIIYGSNHWIRVSEISVDLKVPEAFKGYRMVQITDLHCKQFGHDQQGLLKKVRLLKPDCIMVTGDLLNNNGDSIASMLQFTAKLFRIAPVYFVEGNHDYWNDDYEVFIKGLKQQGVIVLENQSLPLVRGGETVRIAGVMDPFTHRDDLPKALQACSPEETTILLSHSPVLFERAAAKGVDLTLAGHYHGGQIRIPLIGAIYAPGDGFFPRYDSGLYQKGECYMYLSRGLGYTGIFHFRFLNRPELSLIILK